MTRPAPATTALIIVDVQSDFCPGGALAVGGGDQIVGGINALRAGFQTVVVTQDWHPAGHSSFASSHPGKQPFDNVDMPYGAQVLWPDHCVQGSDGAAFHPDLNVQTTDLVLQKGTSPAIDSYSGFFENDHTTRPRFADGSTLTDSLRARGITDLVLVGLAYDFCVGWHALDARREGFGVTVLKPLTRAIAMPLAEGATSETAMDTQLRAAGAVVAAEL